MSTRKVIFEGTINVGKCSVCKKDSNEPIVAREGKSRKFFLLCKPCSKKINIKR